MWVCVRTGGQFPFGVPFNQASTKHEGVPRGLKVKRYPQEAKETQTKKTTHKKAHVATHKYPKCKTTRKPTPIHAYPPRTYLWKPSPRFFLRHPEDRFSKFSLPLLMWTSFEQRPWETRGGGDLLKEVISAGSRDPEGNRENQREGKHGWLVFLFFTPNRYRQD